MAAIDRTELRGSPGGVALVGGHPHQTCGRRSKQTAEPTAADAHPAQAADHASERLMTNGAWPTRDNGSAGIAGVEQNGSGGAMAVAEPWCQRQPVVAMKATVPATR